jgi:hypothetical protein
MATITIKINEEIFHFQIDIFAKAKQMNFYHDIFHLFYCSVINMDMMLVTVSLADYFKVVRR